MSPSRRMTLRELAALAGVSVSTASNALNDTGRMAEETRQLIRRLADQHGYRPNAAARSLRRASTGTIAFFLHPRTTGMGYYRSMVMTVFHLAMLHGLQIQLIGPTELDADWLVAHVDGVILSDPFFGHPRTRALLSSGLPVVTVERPDPAMPAPAGVVRSAHDIVMRRLLDGLRSRGMRQPALVTAGTDFPTDWSGLVGEAYTSWCAEHRRMPLVRPIPFDATHRSVRRAVHDLLRQHPAVDAVIGGHEGIAIGVAGAIAEAGRQVGEDIAVASCVDDAVLQYCAPQITGIDLFPERAVTMAFDLLLEAIDADRRGAVDDAPTPRVLDLPPVIRWRESTPGKSPKR